MKKIIKTSWRYIRRSPYQALAAIAVMTTTLFAIGVFVLLAAGSEKVLAYFEAKPQVIAFFKDEMGEEEINALTLELFATEKVDSVEFVSKEEALEIYREQNKDDPLLLEMVSAEILPASLEVSTKEIIYLEEIAGLLGSQTGVEEVSFQKDVVQVLQKITLTIRVAGITLVSFLVIVSFLVVLVIIGMKAANRRREIKIMQLVGATTWYIKAPFLIEGIFYGVASSVLAWTGTYLLLLYSTPLLVEFLADIPLFPISVIFMLLLLLGLILGGVVIGSFGGWLAVRRYL